MIDIQQHALRALEQNTRASLADLLQALPHRLSILKHEVGDFRQFSLQPLAVHRRLIEAGTQGIVVGTQALYLWIDLIQMRQIAHPDRSATHLVFVSRTDAATRCANLALSGSSFTQSIQIAVQRQDQRAIVGNGEIVIIDSDALPLQLLDFGLQRPRVQHHAIADDRKSARHDTAGQQAEFVSGVPHHQCVAGIVAALKPHHGVGTRCQPVDDLALALVAPLCADHGYICQVSISFKEARCALGDGVACGNRAEQRLLSINHGKKRRRLR